MLHHSKSFRESLGEFSKVHDHRHLLSEISTKKSSLKIALRLVIHRLYYRTYGMENKAW